MATLRLSLLCIALLTGWGLAAQHHTMAAADAPQTTSTSAELPTSSPMPAPALDPARGKEVGLVFEAYLSPHQEGNEEQNTPSSVPKQFRSTTASMTRAEREAAGHRGHGQLRFSKDFSRAWVDVKIEGVDLSQVNMFHIHCGDPGILGPILVDFSLATDINKNLADGLFSIEIRNEHVAKTAGVYPEQSKTFPIGTAMNKNLTIQMGNCHHGKYIPMLLPIVQGGTFDPARILTQAAPLGSVIEAYERFDLREQGWIKVMLEPKVA